MDGWTILGILGGVGAGYWLGNKALPKTKRMEETEALLDLAERLHDQTLVADDIEELEEIIKEIKAYRNKGIAALSDLDENETEKESRIKQFTKRLKRFVKREPQTT